MDAGKVRDGAQMKEDDAAKIKDEAAATQETLGERLAEYGRKPHRVVVAQQFLSPASFYWHMRETQRGTVFIEFDIYIYIYTHNMYTSLSLSIYIYIYISIYLYTCIRAVPFQQSSANLSWGQRQAETDLADFT